ncbi:hypothetical protein BY458DRAFT_450671 [Sporodiniella umbellata]|nr:hypothetical protein BY458DRAFT_450671 [Sporodiniella umbellata]
MSYYLGLDLSTQQLKFTVIDNSHNIVLEEAIHFDKSLPEFNTKNGAIVNGDVVTSPTLMWVKAFDLAFEKLKSFPYKDAIRGISGAGQQHGSVYWSQQGIHALENLDANKSLEDQLRHAFAIEQSPIWQDSSTTKECRTLEQHVGGAEALAKLTGSKAYERFTGNQIAKIYTQNKNDYDRTQSINLVSSFMASLLLGSFAPVDAAEGSGTNMMNIETHHWEKSLIEKCGGVDLQKKLGSEPVEGGHTLGNIGNYFVERYGFSPDCSIMPFTGDNSATLASMNLAKGDCVVSLGTSDTVLVYLSKEKAEPTTESHLMAHPTDINGYMGMLCYKNGSLARQNIRDTYANGDWEIFNKLLNEKEAATKGCFGFYFSMQEIIPFAKGTFRFQDGELVEEFQEPLINAKAIVESQFISMKTRLKRMGGDTKRILASGGAAANTTILKLLADIVGLPVYKQKGLNGASLGGALLAKFGCSHYRSFEEMMKEHSLSALELICRPDLEKTALYDGCINQFSELEYKVVQQT